MSWEVSHEDQEVVLLSIINEVGQGHGKGNG